MTNLAASLCEQAGLAPAANHLLGALLPGDLRRWLPQLKSTDMPAGMSLRQGSQHSEYVYFPTTANVSMQRLTYNGDSLEVVAVGNEGMVGVSAILGGGSIAEEAVVRTGGQAYRLSSVWLQRDFSSNTSVMRLMLRYVHALMIHTAHSVACNRHHSVEQRLCRCLLRCLDGSRGPTLRLTHENLACMLGARRAGVTEATLKLQHAGLIDYARGNLVVHDRAGLEARSCECYSAMRLAYENVHAPGRCRSASVRQTHLERAPSSLAGR